MIIQYPDGSYEVCPLPPAAARWLGALFRRKHASTYADQEDCAAPSVCCAPCQNHDEALCEATR